jgi:hypothetical protein
MKLCDYCGRENEDQAVNCRECGGQEFKDPGPEIQDKTQRGDAQEAPQCEVVAPDTPTTCEWCGRENSAEAVTCHECGTPIRSQKAEAKIRPTIPKPQKARWAFRTLTPQEMKLDLVILLTCRSIVEADVIVGQLESIGISAFIPDEFLAQTMAWNLNAFGYVRVQVSPKDYEQAKDFLMNLSESPEPDTQANDDLSSASGSSEGENGPSS